MDFEKTSEWRKSDRKIADKRCLEHQHNKDDLQIFGRNGIILQTGPSTFSALIDNHKIFNKLKLSANAIKGEELIYRFGLEEFREVYSAIKVPRSLDMQIEFAKRFSSSLTPFKTCKNPTLVAIK